MCNRNINISGTRSFIIHIGGMNLKTKEQNNLVNCNKTTKIADKHNNFIWSNINTLCTPCNWLRKIDFDFEGKLKLVKQPIVPYSTMNSGQENTATSNVWPISWHILFGKHNLYTINAISIDKV